MFIKSLHLKHFRCFSDNKFELDAPIVLIEGKNGSGKTTIIEALHYLCYLRSFRTHLPQELFEFEKDNFFIKATYKMSEDDAIETAIQAGVENKKKRIKINQTPVSSYKQLLDHYRVVSITEDDLALVKGGPEERRNYLDQAVMILDPSFLKDIREFKKILQNRNSLLQHEKLNNEMYLLWTEKLWEASLKIKKKRIQYLKSIAKNIDQLIKKYFESQFSLKFKYKPKLKNESESYGDLAGEIDDLFNREKLYRRSLFGAHLDDFTIEFNDRKSKQFASRGQQKLIILLMKVAQIIDIEKEKGACLFFLDDFITDLDNQKIEVVLSLISDLLGQKILTAPMNNRQLQSNIKKYNNKIISLD